MMKVNEGSSAFINYSLLDEDGNLISSPDLLEYKVTSNLGTSLVDWTTVSGATSTGTVMITGNINTKVNNTDTTRFVTLRCTYNAVKKSTNEYSYILKDLKGI